MASLTLGATELPLPKRDGIGVDDAAVGAGRRMHDASYRLDYSGVKAQINLNWEGLKAAEWAALKAAVMATALATPTVLTLPDGQSFAVMTGAGSWRERQYYDITDTPYYEVSVTLMEV